jgi:cation:H+ antiporter
MITIILFFLGFVLLVYGANYLVDASASIAKKYGVSNLVIGLTIVALGTSAPELVVNLIASFQDAADVAMGNILGSNISNIFLILGISAIIYPLSVSINHPFKKIPFALEIPFALFGAIIIGVLANDYLFTKATEPVIGRINGIILMVIFLGFMYYTFKFGNTGTDDEIEVKSYPLKKSILLIIAGIAGLVLGGKWIVDGATKIASMLGMGEAIISLTIVALGTSLPELATCVVAAYKKNSGLVIGNIVGSNIFNVFFVLGISSTIQPIDFNTALNFDILVGVFSTVLLFVFLFMPQKNVLNRWQGWVLLLLYFGYILVLILQETKVIVLGF